MSTRVYLQKANITPLSVLLPKPPFRGFFRTYSHSKIFLKQSLTNLVNSVESLILLRVFSARTRHNLRSLLHMFLHGSSLTISPNYWYVFLAPYQRQNADLFVLLQEASLADISYLFEEGTLVDFEIDELIRLIKALFADSALRTNTINKVMAGHPVASAQFRLRESVLLSLLIMSIHFMTRAHQKHLKQKHHQVTEQDTKVQVMFRDLKKTVQTQNHADIAGYRDPEPSFLLVYDCSLLNSSRQATGANNNNYLPLIIAIDFRFHAFRTTSRFLLLFPLFPLLRCQCGIIHSKEISY